MAFHRLTGGADHVFAASHQAHHLIAQFLVLLRIGQFSGFKKSVEGLGVGRGGQLVFKGLGQVDNAAPILWA